MNYQEKRELLLKVLGYWEADTIYDFGARIHKLLVTKVIKNGNSEQELKKKTQKNKTKKTEEKN